MVLPGHLAGGYLSASILLTLTQPALSHSEILTIIITATLAGELPDIDIGILFLEHLFSKGPHKESHREYITHAPLFWLMISLGIVGLAGAENSIFYQYIGWAILCGTWTHFLLDSIEHGITWLSPFSMKRFYLRKAVEAENSHRKGTIPYYIEHIRNDYIKTWTFYAEIIVLIVAVFFVVK